MNTNSKYVSWSIRILIALLFIISAAAKLYPSPYFAITTFEVKQLYTLGFSESLAPFFSRILIGIEFALGFLLLSNYFLRRITIPATLLMLVVFTIHLTIITYFTGGSEGNCGCFGELLPMTPLEAIIKNVIAIALLAVLMYLLKGKTANNSNFWFLTTVIFASILMVFTLTFSQPSSEGVILNEMEANGLNVNTAKNSLLTLDTEEQTNIKNTIQVTSEINTISDAEKESKVAPAVKSGYAKYFSDIDSDTKILCLFVPGCSHCAEAAKTLTEMKLKDANFPKIQILFMDEEAEKIPTFFENAGAKYDYKVIDIIGFWKLLGTNKDVPGIKLLKNGKEIKYFYGTADNAFSESELNKLIKQNK